MELILCEEQVEYAERTVSHYQFKLNEMQYFKTYG